MKLYLIRDCIGEVVGVFEEENRDIASRLCKKYTDDYEEVHYIEVLKLDIDSGSKE